MATGDRMTAAKMTLICRPEESTVARKTGASLKGANRVASAPSMSAFHPLRTLGSDCLTA